MICTAFMLAGPCRVIVWNVLGYFMHESGPLYKNFIANKQQDRRAAHIFTISPSFSSVASSVMGEKLPTTLPGTQLVNGSCAGQFGECDISVPGVNHDMHINTLRNMLFTQVK